MLLPMLESPDCNSYQCRLILVGFIGLSNAISSMAVSDMIIGNDKHSQKILKLSHQVLLICIVVAFLKDLVYIKIMPYSIRTHILTHIKVSSAAAAVKSLQSCSTLCDLVDGSLPGSPIPEILQARTLE